MRVARKVLASTAALTLFMATDTACSGPEGPPCISPRTLTEVFPGDKNANPNDQATWLTGVLLTTDIPKGAKGVIVSFRNSDSLDWQESTLITGKNAGRVAMRIGPGEVQFGSQLEFPAKNDDCNLPPVLDVTGVEPYQPLLTTDVVTPEFNK